MRGACIAAALAAICAGCTDPGAARAKADPGVSDGASAPAPVRATRLVLGVSSYYGENVAASIRPLVEHLAAALGIPVELRIAEAYRELPALLARGEIDVAQLPPLAYVRLREKQPGISPVATPIIGGSPTYLGHLYVRDDSPIHVVRELRGARIGYVSKESSSGFLFARDMFRRKGIDPDRFFAQHRFYRSHPQVLAAVLAGEVDVGAAFDATSDWTGPVERPHGLRVVAKTERIPNDCFVARAGLDPGTIDALRRELLRLRPGEASAAEVLAALRINGWVPADEARYERVRAVLARETE